MNRWLQLFWMGVFAIYATGVGAQLGPRDGAQLPPTALDRVQVGSRAPDFTLESSNGARISLSDSLGKEKVVLVFYRGHW